jgi:hypothetical protein
VPVPSAHEDEPLPANVSTPVTPGQTICFKDIENGKLDRNANFERKEERKKRRGKEKKQLSSKYGLVQPCIYLRLNSQASDIDGETLVRLRKSWV